MSDEENKIKQTFSLAEKLFSEKKYRESIKNYEKILEKFPNMIGALNNIALNYEMLGDLDQAVLFYKKCYELKPNETLILNNLANTLYRKNNYDEAIKVYEESLEITNHQDEIINQYSHCIFLTRSKKDNDVFF